MHPRSYSNGVLNIVLLTVYSLLLQAYATLKETNIFRSSRQCDEVYTACEDQVDSLQGLRLPSMAKFSAGIASCNRTFTINCLGPSKALYQKRLEKVRESGPNHRTYQAKVIIPSCLPEFSMSLASSDPLLLLDTCRCG